MQDRFKFRVWDSERKKYIDPSQCLIDGNGKFFYRDDVNGQLYPWTEDFIIEKCTGLKDKNGKLIFEGDVLLWNTPWGELKQLIVVWRGNGFQLYDKESDHYTIIWNTSQKEIIGNVHEEEESNEFADI